MGQSYVIVNQLNLPNSNQTLHKINLIIINLNKAIEINITPNIPTTLPMDRIA